MYISYVRIRNFRNFRDLEVKLSKNAIILGENAAGKSNFIDALRLVLDPSLPDRERKLTMNDFWNGDIDNVPPYKGTCIEVTVHISELDEKLLSFLHDNTVPQNSGRVAEISYRFEPKPNSDIDVKQAGPGDYTFNFYKRKKHSAGSFLDENDKWHSNHELIKQNLSEIRKRLVFQVIPALRDIENSLSSWNRSPLRSLVERLQLQENVKFINLVGDLQQTTEKLRIVEPVEELETEINQRLENMLKGIYDVEPRLNFLPVSEAQLSRSLKLFLDGENWRPLGSTSLGIANILYLVLLSLDAEKRRLEDNEFVILSIEEPEAHLHPHLQRLIFHHYFELSSVLDQPTLITTHSPHLVSIAPLESIVVIHRDAIKSYAASTVNIDEKLGPTERNDLKRYLDATKSEMLFAKGVVLVEGPAEMLLLPVFVRCMQDLPKLFNPNYQVSGRTERITLDQFGITICDVGGVGFKPFIQLLNMLKIPFVVITDGDPIKTENGNYDFMGLRRAVSFIKLLVTDQGYSDILDSMLENQEHTQLRSELKKWGIYVNGHTLETELLLEGNKTAFLETFKDVGAGGQLLGSIEVWIDIVIRNNGHGDLSNDAVEEIIKRIERYPCYGKGRFAQALAERIDPDKVPSYISEAVHSLVALLGQGTKSDVNLS